MMKNHTNNNRINSPSGNSGIKPIRQNPTSTTASAAERFQENLAARMADQSDGASPDHGSLLEEDYEMRQSGVVSFAVSASGHGEPDVTRTDRNERSCNEKNRREALSRMASLTYLSGDYYAISEVDESTVLFAPTRKTKQLLLPTSLVVEWLTAYDDMKIHLEMSPREMRNKVMPDSIWNKQLHSFESHLSAVVRTYASLAAKRSTKNAKAYIKPKDWEAR